MRRAESLVLCLAVWETAVHPTRALNMTRDFQELFPAYDKSIPPALPTRLGIGFYLITMYNLHEADMHFQVKSWLVLRWSDPGLKFSPTDAGETDADNKTWFTLSKQDIKHHIWVPPLYFRNEKDTTALDPDGISEYTTDTRVDADGNLQFLRLCSPKFTCTVELHRYPFDTQTCSIEISVIRYGPEGVQFHRLLDESVQPSTTFTLESLHFSRETFTNCTEEHACFNYSYVLKRNIGYFMLQLYLPSMLVVAISWITFWIDVDAGNQISLAVLLVLTVATLNSSAQANLPRVSYVKAIDIWMLGCLVFVVASLAEAGLVHYTSALIQAKPRDLRDLIQAKSRESQKNGGPPTKEPKNPDEDRKSGERAHVVHRVSRCLFPLCFLIFNLIYWVYYLLNQ